MNNSEFPKLTTFLISLRMITDLKLSWLRVVLRAFLLSVMNLWVPC